MFICKCFDHFLIVYTLNCLISAQMLFHACPIMYVYTVYSVKGPVLQSYMWLLESLANGLFCCIGGRVGPVLQRTLKTLLYVVLGVIGNRPVLSFSI